MNVTDLDHNVCLDRGDLSDLLSDRRTVMSDDAIDQFQNVDPSEDAPPGKPNGLFYAGEDQWIDWCVNNMPGWIEGERYLYEIEVRDHRILQLDTSEKIQRFHRRYVDGDYGFDVSWGRVDDDWSGIEMMPYIYQHRMDYMWYNGWDVPSGAVWHEDAVESIDLVARVEFILSDDDQAI